MDSLFIIFIAGLIIYICYMAYKNFKNNQDILKLQYLGGYPGLKGPKTIGLREIDDCIEFEGFNVRKRDITDVKLVLRSVIGGAGAALGAIVAGPIGALIGGAAAAGSPGASNIIQLSFTRNGINYELFFADADIINKYPLVQQMIREGRYES